MIILSLVLALSSLSTPTQTDEAKDWVVYEGKSGPGKGKSIVFLSGDEEYRSEEGLPQLAKILAYRFGFKCTVLFSVNAKGEINPTTQDNEPGMAALDTADLCVMLLRFRHWPDVQMKHFVDYYLAGKPIIALRTSTHAFDYKDAPQSAYAKFGWQSHEWAGGFGKQVLGETWVSHWGDHGIEGTRGVIAARDHAILRGVKDLFVTTDVYEAKPPQDAEILVSGQVMSGLHPSDHPSARRKATSSGVEQAVNDPMMPVAWVRNPVNESGKRNLVLTTTMGAATDLLNEGLRRMIINGSLWAVGLGDHVTNQLDVNLVGDYSPTRFGFGGFKKGVRPIDLESPGASSHKPPGSSRPN